MPPNGTPNEAPMSFNEVLGYLGVSKKTLRNLLSNGKIRAYQPSKKILIYKSELIEDLKKFEYSTNG